MTRAAEAGNDTLTHNEDGVPPPTGQVRDVMQGPENGPRKGGAHLRAEALVGRHPQTAVACVAPGKDLVV